jgi:glycosyltransferase involved in cell wall biosynthesis
VAISDFQMAAEPLPNIRTIHHGIDLAKYSLQVKKSEYLSFLGRLAPCKGADLAIAVAKKVGMSLKIAGEVQPIDKEYFDSEIRPHLDGNLIEYVGEADLDAKNELLGHSLAMLFPITWDEPFGLVMIEAMACGTPVLALSRGSAPEVVQTGLSGYVCQSIDDLAKAVQCAKGLSPIAIRAYVDERFSANSMAKEYLETYQSAVGSRWPANSMHKQRPRH